MKLNIFLPKSFKARVTIFTLSIFIFSIWALSLYISRMLREDMQHLLSSQQFSTVTILAAQVNQQLDMRLRALETIAANITPAMLDNTPSMQTRLEQRPLLQNLFNGGIFTTRLDGIVTASLPISAGRSGVNLLDRDHIAGALKEGKATISRPILGKVLHAPTIGMAVPIRNARGKVIGALGGVTNLGKPNFLEEISGNNYGKTGGYILFAREHRLIVTATDKSRIMQPLPASGISPTIDRFIQGYEGSTVYTNSLGVEVLNSFKLIPLANWSLVATLPTAEAFAPIHDMQQHILAATILLTLLAAGLTWWILSHQLAPVLATVKMMKLLSDSHQTPHSLPVTRHDEIGELIGCFNRLLDNLRLRDEEVQHLAHYDQLTQLPNRRLLDDRLSQAMAASKRSGKYAALMFIDLDNFKPLNDTHGHVVGDLLLIEAASRLKNCVREIDTVARFGGDEFVVMLSNLDTDKGESIYQAEIIAEKIRFILSQPYLLTIKQEGEADTTVEHHCTASIGVALFINDINYEADIIKWADTAMYQAKKAGRNMIRFLDINQTIH